MSRRPRLDDQPPQQPAMATSMYGQKGVLDFKEANMLANPMLAAAAGNPYLMASLQANTNATTNALANSAMLNPLLANLNPMPNPMLAAASGASAFAPPDVMAQNILAAQALAQIHSKPDPNTFALLQQNQLALQQQAAMQQLAMQQAALSLPFGADAHTAALLAAQSADATSSKSVKNRGFDNPSQQPLTPQMSIAVAQAKAVADILRCNDASCGNQQTRKQATSSSIAAYEPPRTRSRAGPGGASMGKTTSKAKEVDNLMRENIRRCVESRYH